MVTQGITRVHLVTEQDERKMQVDTIRDVSNSELNNIIDEWVHSERDRAIIKRRLIDGICYEPLAEEFDMSVRQIKRIVYKTEKLVYNHL